MKLRNGEAIYTIPEHSDILGVRVEGNQPENQMWAKHIVKIRSSELQQIKSRYRKPLQGLPEFACFMKETVEFWPVPDKEYIVTLRYTPPVKEF